MAHVKNSDHLTNCCVVHGCKYGATDCPVETGVSMQTLPCSFCPDEVDALIWDKLFVASAAKRALLYGYNAFTVDTIIMQNTLEMIGGHPTDVYESRYPNIKYAEVFSRLYDAVDVAKRDGYDDVTLVRDDVLTVLFD